METKEELSERWWQAITMEQAKESMIKYGIYGHDQGADQDDVIGMWIEAGSPIIPIEGIPETNELIKNESTASVKAIMDYASDHAQYSHGENKKRYLSIMEDCEEEMVIRLKQIFG